MYVLLYLYAGIYTRYPNRFNPIASSLMVKALSRILSVEGAGHAQPNKEVLSALVETSGGDIRSAVNALQFATKKGKEGECSYGRVMCEGKEEKKKTRE